MSRETLFFERRLSTRHFKANAVHPRAKNEFVTLYLVPSRYV